MPSVAREWRSDMCRGASTALAMAIRVGLKKVSAKPANVAHSRMSIIPFNGSLSPPRLGGYRRVGPRSNRPVCLHPLRESFMIRYRSLITVSIIDFTKIPQ